MEPSTKSCPDLKRGGSAGRKPEKRGFPCYFEAIHFLAIAVCIVGHRFGHGRAVVITTTREVKSASSRGSKNQMCYPQIDAFSTLITKAHTT